jgi:hypothetical protein
MNRNHNDNEISPSLHKPHHDSSDDSFSWHQRKSNKIPYWEFNIKVNVLENGSFSNNDQMRHLFYQDIQERI